MNIDIKTLEDEQLIEAYKIVCDYIKYLEENMGDNND